MTAYFEPARTYGVELLCRSEPQLNKTDFLRELRRSCPDASPLDGNETGGSLAIVHPGHLIQYRDRAAPAQALIVVSDRRPDPAALKPSIEQSWRLDNAIGVVEACSHSVLVTDMMASRLEYQTRFDLFHSVLRAALATIPSDAIHWVQSQQIVGTEDFVTCQDGSLADTLGGGPINVRLFNIENSQGEVLMDTRGMSSFGLSDLQCHFRGLVTQDVARVLYNTAFYIFENGEVIEDGHTVAGITPDSKWLCQHEDALVEPDRVVLDLNPGSPFVAGGR